jgi:hypothetical protein
LADTPRDATLLDELLKLSAPAPDWREQLARTAAERETPPGPEAPIETLAEFWRHAPPELRPDQGVPPRLLEWCEAHPEALGDLLRWFPTDTPEFHDRLKAVAERLASRSADEPKWRDTVDLAAGWLMFHSRYFRDELIAATREAFAGRSGDEIAKHIEALVRLDRPAADKLLRELAESSDAFTKAAGLVWLHKLDAGEGDHERAGDWRAALQGIVTDTAAAPRARDYALWGLMQSRWPGQEEWLLGLFRDASLGEFRDPLFHLRPLGRVASDDPDRWIPRIVPLVGGPDRTAHNNAVRCLSEFHLEKARVDALRPLLPWLSDPKWADIEDDIPRLRVVQSLDRVDLPESVPGLIWILGHERGYFLTGAAEALQHYKVKEAGEALKTAISREPDDYHRRSLIRAASTLGAFSAEEMARAIAAYVDQLATEKGREAVEYADLIAGGTPLDPQVSIGSELWHLPIDSAELVELLLRRAAELAATQPESAERLRVIVAGWPGKAATEFIVKQLQTGELSRPLVAQILARWRELAAEVGRIEGLRGPARGVQVAVVGAQKEIDETLRGGDRAATAALLASARHVRLALPLAAVEPLLESADTELARAAEAYLISEDSPTARAAVLRRHPGEARILGSRLDYDPGHETYGPFSATEEHLRTLVRADDGPREILALLSEGYWGNIGQRLVLVFADRTVLRWLDGGGRQRERMVTPEELARLRAWLAAHEAENLAPFDQGAADGSQYEFVRVTRDGGRRVFMNNPPGRAPFSAVFPGGHANEPDPSIYGRLVEQFEAVSSLPMEVSYEALRRLPGFRLLHEREKGEVAALIIDGGKLIAQVYRESFSYHALEEKGLAPAEVETPESFREGRGLGRWESDFLLFPSGPNAITGPCTGRLSGQYVWAGSRNRDNLEGLWLSDEKTEPSLIASGKFGRPVVTPDGEWIVVAKAGGAHWSVPNGVVRIRVADRRELPVDLPAADNFDAVAWLPAHEKVLLFRAKDEVPSLDPSAGPDQPEYHLLDPASGKLTTVQGEFRPLSHQARRSMQPTANSNEMWAALPAEDDQEEASLIGRYDTARFTFTPMLKVPGLRFSSPDLWIDASTNAAFIVANGDVLRLSLP